MQQRQQWPNCRRSRSSPTARSASCRGPADAGTDRDRRRRTHPVRRGGSVLEPVRDRERHRGGQANGRRIGRAGPGDVVGELGVILGGPRTATVLRTPWNGWCSIKRRCARRSTRYPASVEHLLQSVAARLDQASKRTSSHRTRLPRRLRGSGLQVVDRLVRQEEITGCVERGQCRGSEQIPARMTVTGPSSLTTITVALGSSALYRRADVWRVPRNGMMVISA